MAFWNGLADCVSLSDTDQMATAVESEILMPACLQKYFENSRKCHQEEIGKGKLLNCIYHHYNDNIKLKFIPLGVSCHKNK